MNRRSLISLMTALALASGGAMAASMPVAATATAKSHAPMRVAAGKDTRCRDAKGHFQKCAPKPAASKTCRDAKGKFASCKR